MLSKNNAVATIAVKDLAQARKFYEGKLGFTLAEEANEMVLTYSSGESIFFVYKSDFAGGYKATVATWPMADGLDDIVKTLKDKGVSFKHYKDMPDTTLEGDVHVSGDMRAAWFKDPEGNILSLVQAPQNA